MFVFNHSFSTSYWEVLANAVGQEKELKSIQIGKEDIKMSFITDDIIIIYVEHQKELTKKTDHKTFWD